MTKLKSIAQLKGALQIAKNASDIRDFNVFGYPHSVYRPYIIIALNINTPTITKQKLIEHIYTSYENIHFVELVNQTACICVDYEHEQNYDKN